MLTNTSFSDNSLPDFISLSHWAAERFDLVQGKGGNSSVKLDTTKLLVKASGVGLGEITATSGYTQIDYPKVLSFLQQMQGTSLARMERESLVEKSMPSFRMLKQHPRPSIETFFHAFFAKYTLHLHPILLLSLLSGRLWREATSKLWDGALLIDYYTPGIDLGLHLLLQVQEYRRIHGRDPVVIFLQNHGVVVSAETIQDVQEIVETIIARAQQWLAPSWGEVYRLGQQLTMQLQQLGYSNLKAFLSHDAVLRQTLHQRPDLFYSRPLCPDDVVFWGATPLAVKTLEDVGPEISQYQQLYLAAPKVLTLAEEIFLLATSTQKAKEVEEMLRAHLMARELQMQNDCNFLNLEEIRYLNNWEAEKYRAQHT